jgi:hypothetical protein
MSKIALKPNASGTGVFSLEAPNSNVDRTLTLRDETGDLVTTATDLEPQVKDSLNATGSAPVYACRAWVNFDGTGTVSIRGSGNVSSITDGGTGEYTVNFTTAMPDADYSTSISVINDGSGEGRGPNGAHIKRNSSFSTSSFSFNTLFGGKATADGGLTDLSLVCASVFR